MLKIKTSPVLLRIISKLDVKPIMEKMKEANIFKDTGSKSAALAEIKGEKAVELGFELIAEIMPQLYKIADDFTEFVSLYEGVTIEEAMEYDLAEIINKLINDEGIRNFFSTALRKKVEREH